MRVTIAGASGFVGRSLVDRLKENSDILIKCLGRSFNDRTKDNISFKFVDLFSQSSTDEALSDTDVAIFLIHSMSSSTRLFQGTFKDCDLMITDNFARACKRNKVKHIIYLGGIIPHGKISDHLESRKEVEDILLDTGIPTSILRAGMIVGNGGSSFEILKNLSKNLPLMVLPKWTSNITHVVHIDDVVEFIIKKVLDEKVQSQVYNLVEQEIQSFKDLIIESAKFFKHSKPIFVSVPINYISLSKFWVSLFGEAELELVSPLIDSLLCDFDQISAHEEFVKIRKYHTYKQMLESVNKDKFVKAKNNIKKDNSVRSIQRLLTNHHLDINQVSDFYFSWLPKKLKSIVYVLETDDIIHFKLRGVSSPLLTLKYIRDCNIKDRNKFHIVGGLLTKTNNTGWLEFRNILHGKYLLASINEFRPSLPWSIYRLSQAVAHELVMNSFSKDLGELDKS